MSKIWASAIPGNPDHATIDENAVRLSFFYSVICNGEGERCLVLTDWHLFLCYVNQLLGVCGGEGVNEEGVGVF